MSGRDFSEFLRVAGSVSVEELAREQGVTPAGSLEELRAEVWDSDEELDAFLTDLRESRQADLD